MRTFLFDRTFVIQPETAAASVPCEEAGNTAMKTGKETGAAMAGKETGAAMAGKETGTAMAGKETGTMMAGNSRILPVNFAEKVSCVRERPVVYGAEGTKAPSAGLSIHLLNYDNHKERLKECPLIHVEDLAVVFYRSTSEKTSRQSDSRGADNAAGTAAGADEQTSGTVRRRRQRTSAPVLVRDEDLLRWQCSPGQIFRSTLIQMADSAPAKLMTLSSAIGLSEDEDPDESAPDLYVLTNQQQNFGAAVLLYPGLLSQIACRWQSSFYIIPSSVHELILIPERSMIPLDDMREIISEINRQELTFDEILSDEVYYYDRSRDRFSIARE